ncbi:NUDIX domain-containing protein [Nonomuraea sp. NPDC050643]|uniref:NUDIX hydrolase n=1 Tax=Nonomuraea sp. NPDC050643 TaxID=3155660 RepID=UPI0033C11681
MMRSSVRAIVLDPGDRILLCRHDLTRVDGPVVWAMPGGGIEPGESRAAALRRELSEEIGLRLDGGPAPPHVWHQSVAGSGYAPGYDGVINDYYLIRTRTFEPRGDWSDEQLAAEHITDIRWWTFAGIAAGSPGELFSPRALAGCLGSLLTEGVPDAPIHMGL